MLWEAVKSFAHVNYYFHSTVRIKETERALQDHIPHFMYGKTEVSANCPRIKRIIGIMGVSDIVIMIITKCK